MTLFDLYAQANMNESNTQINVLFLGDIVGRPGRNIVKYYLGDLLSSEQNKYDFIIANVENASHGFGLTEKNHKELGELGINCFTSGNHIWDKKDVYSYINNSDKLIRPWNYPKGTYGVGYRIFEVKNTKIAVLNFLGRTFMNPVDSPWEIIQNEIEKIKQEAPIVIVDFHAEATAEKICFGKFCCDHRISAVLGTHTHVQTADEKIINDYFSYEIDLGKDYALLMFCGESEDARQFEAFIQQQLQHCGQISFENLDLLKRRYYGEAMRTFNNVEDIAVAVVRNQFNGVSFFDTLDMIEGLTQQTLLQAWQTLDFSHHSLVEICPPRTQSQ